MWLAGEMGGEKFPFGVRDPGKLCCDKSTNAPPHTHTFLVTLGRASSCFSTCLCLKMPVSKPSGSVPRAFLWESFHPSLFFPPQNGSVTWSDEGDGCRGREISRDFAKVGLVPGDLGKGGFGEFSP